jgi:ankyrin repeat protein
MNETILSLIGNKQSIYPRKLEELYPRILNKIVDLWHTPELEDYFAELMIDTRASQRQGFPPEVASEIFHLSQAYDQSRGLQDTGGDPWNNVDMRKRYEIEELGYQVTPQDYLKAAENQDRKAIGLYLSAGFPVDFKDDKGWTPLMISSFNGNAEIAELLIRSGANVQAKDNAGYGPMHWAAYNGYSSVVKLLISKLANVNAISTQGLTPLLQAAARGHLITCAALIAGGAQVNVATDEGWTALHKACANGHTEVVKLLLAHGADRTAKHRNGETPLSIAEQNKRADIVALLSR